MSLGAGISQKSSKIRQLATEEIKLKQGTTLLYTHVPTAPRLAISMFLPGGNLLDPIPGLSDMVDRLLLKGTTTRSQEAISIEIDGLTLDVDTDTRRDYMAIHATLLEEDWDASMALIADLFYNATFSEFEREKQKTSGEILMELDSPKHRASDLLMRSMFENTPYGTVSSVILEQLPKMTSVNELKTFYQRAFRPDNLVVSIAGAITADKAAKSIEKYFNAQPKGLTSVNDTSEISHWEALLSALSFTEDREVTFPRDDSTQAHIFKGWLMPNARHEDYSAFSVLNTILGAAGLSSRLFLELRDKQGLAYNVRSTYEAYRHKGLFYLYIGTEPTNKKKCLKGFVDEVNKLINIPVEAEELANAKRNSLGRRSVFLETAQQQANYIGANYILGRTLAEIEQIPEKIQSVTAADIQRVAQTYLTKPTVTSIVATSKVL